MRFDWQQLSPGERQVLIRHFLFHPNAAVPVTPEKVCAVMQKTHQMTCYTKKDGKAVIEFITISQGARSGVSTADTFTDGIFKAALRAKGVQLEDGAAAASPVRTRMAELVHA